MNSKIVFASLVLSAIAFLLWGAISLAHAEECKWWEIGCKPAQVIGRNVKEGMLGAADELHSTVNYWQWLIEKYHVGSDEEKAQARELISKVFGADAIDDVNPFEVSFMFEGIDTSENELELIVLRDYQVPDVAGKVFRGNSSDFNAMPIVGVVPPAKSNYEDYIADLQTIRARVDAKLAEIKNSPLAYKGERLNHGGTVCTSLSAKATYGRGVQPNRSCADRPYWVTKRADLERLVEAIMITVDPKIEKRANRTIVKIPYEGYNYLTIVFPEEQILAQPNLVLSINIHRKDQPDKSIPIFEGNDWTISQASLTAYPSFTSPARKEHSGRYVAYTISMGL